MSDTIKVEIPRELADLLGSDEGTIEKRNLESLILSFYAEGKLTLSKASNLLEIKVDELQEKFRNLHYKRKGFPSDINEAEQDFREALKD